MMKTKIILVDDHKLFRDGLKLNLFEYSNDFEIIAETQSAEELFSILTNQKPDLILLDCELLGINGIEAGRQLKSDSRYKDIKIIMLSAHKSYRMNSPCFDVIVDAIDAGIEGFLLKDSSIEEIITSINEVLTGKYFVLGETINIKEVNKILIKDRKRLMFFLNKYKNFGLTDREIEIIHCLAEGMEAKRIAAKLNIAEESVNSHKNNIKLKLKENHDIHLQNTVEIVVWAIKSKIIEV